MGIPNAYQKALDDSIASKGSILKVVEMYQKDTPTSVVKIVDGFTKTKTDEAKRFFLDDEPPLFIELTVSTDFDDIEIYLNNGGGLRGGENIDIDRGDGVFVNYFQQNQIIFTPLGTNIIIKSTSDFWSIKINDYNDKGFG